MKLAELASGVTPEEFAALLASRDFMIADLYRFTLVTGFEDFFTSLDAPVSWGGNVYKADSLRIWGLSYKQAVGLEVDEQTVKIAYYPGETLAGADFVTAAQTGLLDGAYVSRMRAFWEPTTGNPSIDFLASPKGVVQLTYGLVSEITRAGRTQFEMKVKSPLVLLDTDLPRNYYQPSCLHTLFDSGCTLVKSSFGVTGTVGASPSSLLIPWSGGVVTPTGADSLPNYAAGRLLFTSGTYSGEQFSVSTNDSSNLALAYPLFEPPDPGDTFTAYPGCQKTPTTCEDKFNNLIHFRGFPRVPPIYASI